MGCWKGKQKQRFSEVFLVHRKSYRTEVTFIFYFSPSSSATGNGQGADGGTQLPLKIAMGTMERQNIYSGRQQKPQRTPRKLKLRHSIKKCVWVFRGGTCHFDVSLSLSEPPRLDVSQAKGSFGVQAMPQRPRR